MQKTPRIVRPLLALALVAALVISSVAAMAQSAPNAAFVNTWARTDAPVADGSVQRTWIWGPLSTAWPTREGYVQSPGGQRDVMYFDKSRMEINNPSGNPNDLWYVTNGLLVVEMITGQMQTGDASFTAHGASIQNVAGDQGAPNSPTYASFAGVRDVSIPNHVTAITRQLNANGSVVNNAGYASWSVGAATYVHETDHWVADPFWAFMNSRGIVQQGNSRVMGNIFANPFYGTGFPISEAYWATVRVAGTPTDVLIQCFERRCLTYTPTNDANWRVEAGNVGRHYYAWRYGHEMPGTSLATAYMVSIGTGGATNVPLCDGDSLMEVQIPVWPGANAAEQIRINLTMLLSSHDEHWGESGFYNALYRNSAAVDTVSVNGTHATVNLIGQLPSGGVCDDPRIQSQLTETIKAVAGIDSATIMLNGVPIFSLE